MGSPERQPSTQDAMPTASSLVPAVHRSAARASVPASRRAPAKDAAEERRHEEDEERIRRAARGDATAFEEIYRSFRPAVFKVAYGVTGNVEDALDVTQETFLKAHRSLELFQGRASVLTWLCQIAIHQAIDLGRRKKVRRAVELEESMRPGRATDGVGPREGHDPAVLAAGNELKDALQRALAELSEKHREVFLLYTIRGLSYREIADSLEVSIGTVMSRLFYARKNLQGLLAEFGG